MPVEFTKSGSNALKMNSTSFAKICRPLEGNLRCSSRLKGKGIQLPITCQLPTDVHQNLSAQLQKSKKIGTYTKLHVSVLSNICRSPFL